MKILFVSSEVSPFAKTGGLADVVGALPQYLARRGHDVRVVMPLYKSIDTYAHRLIPLLPEIIVDWGTDRISGEVMRCSHPSSPADVPMYFIAQELLFDRDGLYGEAGQDYFDNDRRFAFFNFATLWMLKGLNWSPDVIHLNDWQAGMVAALLKHHPIISEDDFYRRIRTVFTIHNMAYQGLFHHDMMPRMNLPWYIYNPDGIEFHNQVSTLKAGIVFSDRITTVSPTYAKEIQTEEHGAGMDGVLRLRARELDGILNGIDDDVWNPETDALIPANYSADDTSGKAKCRKALLKQFGIKDKAGAPVIGMISRLVDQKGFDIVAKAMPEILATGARIVLLGTGEAKHEEFFRSLAARNPGQVGVAIEYNEKTAHLIEAGSDCFLMPSYFEPSGLNQLYSMRYGTIPIVRGVGGLKDSIEHANKKTITAGKATGFVFERYTAGALQQMVKRAVQCYQDQKLWQKLVKDAMTKDFTWDRSAKEYEKVYKKTMKK
ncbi:glycogen synthase GlgA [bacterium]|nr:glycogen synthase GlgA [bacterium]